MSLDFSSHGLRRLFAAGDTVFVEGDPGDAAYLVESGRVEVFVQEGGVRRSVNTLGPGEIFGEMAIVDGAPRSAGVVTMEGTSLIVISREYFQQKMEATDPVLRLFLQVILHRLRERRVIPRVPVEPMGEALELDREQVQQRLRMHTALRHALEEGGLLLQYQPIVSLSSGEVSGFEALLRWRHPEWGMVSPERFIPSAEESGLIVEIGRWCFEEAARALKRFDDLLACRQPGRGPRSMSVNVSSRQFFDDALVERIAEVVERFGLPSGKLTAEITESLFINDPQGANRFLERLKALGLRIAVDDFGTGYASLTYLHRFPLDALKIDQSFVRTMDADPKGRAIVEALAALALKLRIDVVAEGVEQLGQALSLRAMGCTYGQGFHFSRPLDEEGVIELLKHGGRWRFDAESGEEVQ